MVRTAFLIYLSIDRATLIFREKQGLNFLNFWVRESRMRSLFLTIVTLLTINNISNAQVKITGPNEYEAGEQYVIKFDEIKGNDLQILILCDGDKHDGTGFLKAKDWDNNLQLIVFQKKADCVYTVVASVNNANKTFISIHTLKPKNPSPKPPPPPAPNNQYFKDLSAAYTPPNAEALAKLVQIFESFDTKNYTNYDQFHTILQTAADKFLTKPDGTPDKSLLRPVRDVIANYLKTTQGGNKEAYDATKLTQAINETIVNLKNLK